MEKFLQWTAVRMTRKRALNRTLGLVFGLFAGAAAGIPAIAWAANCIGPWGSGACDPCNCSGHTCKVCGSALCQKTTCCCPGGSGCWSSNGKTCCDCQCRSGSFGWYCYCWG
jgi:hypothetical protein